MTMLKRTLSLFGIGFFVCFVSMALVSVQSQADITGTGAAVQAHPSAGQARWVQVIAQTGNAAAVRVGGSTVSATNGIPVAAGAGFFFPPIPVDQGQPVSTNNYYDLTSIYVYVGSGDKVSVIWGY
jgi:hypothetical protein